MKTRESGAGRTTDSVGRILVLVTGLVVLEGLLLRYAGSPAQHLRVVHQLGDPAADPVAALLDLLALVAEALTAYLVVVVVLRLFAGLPGLAGHLAGRSTRLVTVPVARRTLDAVLGTALMAQVAFSPVVAHAGTLPDLGSGLGSRRATTAPAAAVAAAQAIAGNLQAGAGAGAGSGSAAATYTVRPGDTLWAIAAGYLPAGVVAPAEITAYWHQVFAANRAVIGADPDLIRPGQRLVIPVYQHQQGQGAS